MRRELLGIESFWNKAIIWFVCMSCHWWLGAGENNIFKAKRIWKSHVGNGYALIYGMETLFGYCFVWQDGVDFPCTKTMVTTMLSINLMVEWKHPDPRFFVNQNAAATAVPWNNDFPYITDAALLTLCPHCRLHYCFSLNRGRNQEKIRSKLI